MTKTKTKIEKDPKCVIFLKSRCFEDIKYDTRDMSGASTGATMGNNGQQNGFLAKF